MAERKGGRLTGNRYLESLSTTTILKEVQATIFEPHSRKFARYLFFNFIDADQSKIRDRLVGFISQITTGLQQFEEQQIPRSIEPLRSNQYEEFEAMEVSWQPCITLSLSATGCRKIMNETHPNFPNTDPFIRGMSDFNIRLQLGDEELKKWTDGKWDTYNSSPRSRIDLMVAIADHQKERLLKKTIATTDFFSHDGVCQLLFIEEGTQKYNALGQAIEPFGFRDGLSKVPFWNKQKTELLPHNRSIALDEKLGSYLVFRKLEQDVTGFNSRIAQLVERLFPDIQKDTSIYQAKKAFVEAQFMGRYKDGTPLVFFDQPILENGEANTDQKDQIEQFDRYDATDIQAIDYRSDEYGHKCPFHAHIRKVNPRDAELINNHGQTYGNQLKEFNIRIARRSIPYIERSPHSDEIKEGLLFLCYQADIASQFQIIQQEWSNRQHFPNLEAGIDPLTGKLPNQVLSSTWNLHWNDSEKETVKIDFQDLVKFKGGEYFYTPSISWLKQLQFLDQ